MQNLPLFPLPVVLFPGAWMPLHIFEQRYRDMVSDVVAGDGRFGLIHHDADEQGPFLMEAGRVGTIARIEKHQPLPDGRSMILVRGVERFAIEAEQPMERLYYRADVVPYVDEEVPRLEAILEARAHTLEIFHALIDQIAEPQGPVPEYDLNLDLSFQLAPAVQIDDRWQQALLLERREVVRLERLEAVFQAALERQAPEDG